MRRKPKYTRTVSTVLSSAEYRELERYVRAQDKSTSTVLRELLAPMIHARVSAHSDDRASR